MYIYIYIDIYVINLSIYLSMYLFAGPAVRLAGAAGRHRRGARGSIGYRGIV